MKVLEKTYNIVALGGGTGLSVLLTGLRKYFPEAYLTAIVTMADDGGSTGMLRKELGIPPVGDLRQCLLALSALPHQTKRMLALRFNRGALAGHNAGNIALAGSIEFFGSLKNALPALHNLLRVEGSVLPITHNSATLVAHCDKQIIRGEQTINRSYLCDNVLLSYETPVRIAREARMAILNADIVTIGPGALYSSVLPLLLVTGTSRTLQESKAKKLYLANLIVKKSHGGGRTVVDCMRLIEKYGTLSFDAVLYHHHTSEHSSRAHVLQEDQSFLIRGDALHEAMFFGTDLVARAIRQQEKGDLLPRSNILHDPKKLAQAVRKIAENLP